MNPRALRQKHGKRMDRKKQRTGLIPGGAYRYPKALMEARCKKA